MRCLNDLKRLTTDINRTPASGCQGNFFGAWGKLASASNFLGKVE
jgi:hypothetical protein